eukprot:362362-Rhodomonas_salina.1
MVRWQLQEALAKAFRQLTEGKDEMDQPCVDKWLLTINRQLGRGSEYAPRPLSHTPAPPPPSALPPRARSHRTSRRLEDQSADMTDSCVAGVVLCASQALVGNSARTCLVLIPDNRFRSAQAKMEAVAAQGGAGLSLQHFTDCYLSELQEGKFWGVDHDLSVPHMPVFVLVLRGGCQALCGATLRQKRGWFGSLDAVAAC